MVGGLGVVLGLVVEGGCPWWGLAFGLVYVTVSRTRGAPPPLGDGCSFSSVFNHFGMGWFGLLSPKKKRFQTDMQQVCCSFESKGGVAFKVSQAIFDLFGL